MNYDLHFENGDNSRLGLTWQSAERILTDIFPGYALRGGDYRGIWFVTYKYDDVAELVCHNEKGREIMRRRV